MKGTSLGWRSIPKWVVLLLAAIPMGSAIAILRPGEVWDGADLTFFAAKESHKDAKGYVGHTNDGVRVVDGVVHASGAHDVRVFVGHKLPQRFWNRTVCVHVHGMVGKGSLMVALIDRNDSATLATGSTYSLNSEIPVENASEAGHGLEFDMTNAVAVPNLLEDRSAPVDPWIGVYIMAGSRADIRSLHITALGFDEDPCITCGDPEACDHAS